MKRTKAGKNGTGYPSIMELALKAGKWTLVAGGSAAIIGSAGCGETTTGILELDGSSVLDAVDGRDYLLGGDDIVITDVAGDDTGQDIVLAGHDVAFLDLQPADAGAFALDEIDTTGDVQDATEEDWGPTLGVPWIPDVLEDDGTVQDQDVVGDVANPDAVDAIEVDPGMPLPGEAMPDIFDTTDESDVQE